MSEEPTAGRLVAIEGIDGAGKSTLVAALARRLRQSGHRVATVTRYMIPDLTKLWRKLVDADAVDQASAATLAAADHWLGTIQHLQPKLMSGSYVLADRSYYSHLVCFSIRGVEVERLTRLFSFAIRPALIVYLSIPPATAERRLRQKNKPDFWEAALDFTEGLTIGAAYRRYAGQVSADLLLRRYRETQRKAMDAYRDLLPPERTLILDGELPADELADRSLRAILELPATAQPCCQNG
jgi:dTMP kinase